MKKSVIPILLLTALLTAAAFLCFRFSPVTEEEPKRAAAPSLLTVQVHHEESFETLLPWEEERGMYHVFLPGYAGLDAVTLHPQPGVRLRIGGRAVTEGMPCDFIQPGQEYLLEYASGDASGSACIRFHRCGELPAIYIDVQSGNMDFIHMAKENEESAAMRIYLATGELDYAGNLRSISGRGNATWENWDKKPYNLKLVAEADLLGMGSAGNWVLLANSYDPTHIRNKIVCDAASEAGLAFSPESRFADLYLNGEYAGLYLLSEKNEIHTGRVEIGKSTGTLISIEMRERLWQYGKKQLITDNGIPVRIQESLDSASLVGEKLRILEGALLSPDGTDPVTGAHWRELIDLESWAGKYLTEEIFGNLDAGSISQFFYWDSASGGRIYAGPVWDYDISMGNTHDWQIDVPRMLYAGRPHLWNPEDTPWFYALWQKDAFRAELARQYRESYRPVLEKLINGGIAACASQVGQSAATNRIRWEGEDARTATEAMIGYMKERMAFLDSLLLEREEYCLVSAYIQDHVMACYAVQPGETLEPWPVPDGWEMVRYEHWEDSATGEAFDFSAPVTEDKMVSLRQTNLNEKAADSAEGFSARSAITYVPAAALVLMLGLMCAVDGKGRCG